MLVYFVWLLCPSPLYEIIEKPIVQKRDVGVIALKNSKEHEKSKRKI